MSGRCEGCGSPLAPNRGPGRQPKWCSERCRKVTLYSRQCESCGAVCNVDGAVAGAARRCGDCNARRSADIAARRAREVAEQMLAMRRTGKTNVEIAGLVGMTPQSVSRSLRRLRDAGADVPPSPYLAAGRD
jgi:hypothetical protein